MRITLVNRSSSAAAWLDFLRWVAALYVVVFHIRPVLFVGFQQVPRTATAIKILYGLTSLGYQSVMLFFVLSGYLVGSSVMKAVEQGHWSWKNYLTQRLTRLWIVLLPALILTWILAQLEMRIAGSTLYFAHTLGWKVALGNLLFLQGVLVPNFGQNLPLWSLTYEFWYYVMFPCLVLVFTAKRVGTKIVYGVLVVVISAFLGKSIVLYFAIWLIGVILALLPSPSRIASRRRLLGRLWILSFVMTLCVLILGKEYIDKLHVPNFDMIESFPANFTVAVMFGLVLYLTIHLFNDVDASRIFKAGSAAFARFSYTLYLTHYPIMNLLRETVGNGTWGTWEPNVRSLCLALAILTGILIYAWFVAKLTEARTTEVRNAVIVIARTCTSRFHALTLFQNGKN